MEEIWAIRGKRYLLRAEKREARSSIYFSEQCCCFIFTSKSPAICRVLSGWMSLPNWKLKELFTFARAEEALEIISLIKTSTQFSKSTNGRTIAIIAFKHRPWHCTARKRKNYFTQIAPHTGISLDFPFLFGRKILSIPFYYQTISSLSANVIRFVLLWRSCIT